MPVTCWTEKAESANHGFFLKSCTACRSRNLLTVFGHSGPEPSFRNRRQTVTSKSREWAAGCARHGSEESEVFFFCALILKVCDTLRRGGAMPDPLSPLVDNRSAVLRQISELGDFQPGSIANASRRCGKPGCHCAKPNDPGHGPPAQLTQKIEGKTVTQNLPSQAAVHKAEKEIAEFRKFQTLSGELVDINRKICRLRPIEQIESTAQEKKRRKRFNKKSPAK